MDGFTLVGKTEMGSERDGDLPFARPALSSAELGGRLRLWQGSGVVVSTAVSARFEEARADDGSETFGWTRPEVETRLLAGYGFSTGPRLWSLPAFVDAEAAYRSRTGEGPDEILVDLTVGLRVRPDTLLLAQSFSTLSTAEEKGEASYAYHKVQGSVVYDLDARWSLQVGAFATVAGRNALREQGLVTAVWFRF